MTSPAHLAAQQRRDAILDLLREQGGSSVTELAQRFGVSAETLRRDLRVLEDDHLVLRSYGDVSAVEAGSFETPLTHRAGAHVDEKRRIAAEAGRHLHGASTLFLDEGYLTSLVVQHLPQDRPVTVLTTSLPTAAALAERANVEVHMVGGRVRTRTLGTVDDWAVRMMRGHAVDLAVMGTNAVSPDGWLTTPDPAVGAVKAAAMEGAGRCLLIASHNKFGRSTFARFARLSQIDTVITGRALTSSQARRYGEHGPQIIRV